VERRGAACEEVESFSEVPTSDNQSTLPNREMEPVLSGTADTLESIERELDILLADEERSSE
jgi:hypothetical protein